MSSEAKILRRRIAAALAVGPAPLEDILDLANPRAGSYASRSISTKLGEMARRDRGPLVIQLPDGRWDLAGGAAMVLAAAAGSATVNAAAFDPSGRVLRATAFTSRAEDLPDDDKLDRLADLLGSAARAFGTARGLNVGRIAAIGVALPFPISPSEPEVTAGLRRRLRDRLAHALGAGHPALQAPLLLTSDVASEGVAEFWQAGDPFEPSPLLVVKATKRLRAAVIGEGGRPSVGASGSTLDLGACRVPPNADLHLLLPTIAALVAERLEAQVASGGARGEVELHLNDVLSPVALGRACFGWDARTAAEQLRFRAGETDEQGFLRVFGTASRQEHTRPGRVFHQAGQLLGRALDTASALIDPTRIVATGHLARAALPFLSGLQAETGRTVVQGLGLVSDLGPDPFVAPRTWIEPAALPHQWRVTLGAMYVARAHFTTVDWSWMDVEVDPSAKKRPTVFKRRRGW